MFPRPDDIDWVYINLSHRKDRVEHITAQLDKAGIIGRRLEARTKEDYHGDPCRTVKMMPTPNTIGNWLSHSRLWQIASTAGNCVGVLEDDALLCSDFRERMTYIHERWDKPWDIMFLGSTYHVNPPVWHKDTLGRDFELTDVKHIHRVYGAFSNQGYVINASSARKVFDLVDSLMPESRGIDHALIMAQPQLECYAFTPGLVFQIDGQSDIGDGFTRFSHFLESLGSHVWCDKLEDFDYDGYDWAEGAVH